LLPRFKIKALALSLLLTGCGLIERAPGEPCSGGGGWCYNSGTLIRCIQGSWQPEPCSAGCYMSDAGWAEQALFAVCDKTGR